MQVCEQILRVINVFRFKYTIISIDRRGARVRFIGKERSSRRTRRDTFREGPRQLRRGQFLRLCRIQRQVHTYLS